jgi:hypothetical protein
MQRNEYVLKSMFGSFFQIFSLPPTSPVIFGFSLKVYTTTAAFLRLSFFTPKILSHQGK